MTNLITVPGDKLKELQEKAKRGCPEGHIPVSQVVIDDCIAALKHIDERECSTYAWSYIQTVIEDLESANGQCNATDPST